MKVIGLLGGTGWVSTLEYYKCINELVNNKLGKYHSAELLLKSIDYNEMMHCYANNPKNITNLLKNELLDILKYDISCLVICCNSLHKFFDQIKEEINITIPTFHAVELTRDYIIKMKLESVLLLATKFTMEDGFFANALLNSNKIEVITPNEEEIRHIHFIHNQLMKNILLEEFRTYFKSLVNKYNKIEAIILGCSEFALLFNQKEFAMPLINPIVLQSEAAVNFSIYS